MSSHSPGTVRGTFYNLSILDTTDSPCQATMSHFYSSSFTGPYFLSLFYIEFSQQPE